MIPLLFLAAIDCSKACVIEHVRIESMKDGSVAESSVAIVNGRIAAKPAPDAVRIDGKGLTLAPGFIAVTSNLGLVEIDAEKSAREGGTGAPFTPAASVLEAFNPRSVWIPIARAAGVTSAVISPNGGVIAGRAAWIDLKVLPTPDPLRVFFGDVSGGAAQAFGGSRGTMWMRLRDVFADARFYKVNKKGYDNGATRALSLSQTQLDAMQPFIDGGLFAVEANRASDILAVLAFAKEQGIRVVIVGGAEAHLVTDALLAAKVSVVLQPSSLTPHSFDRLHTRDDVATLLHKAGVSFAIYGQALRVGQEAGRAVAYGLPHHIALAAVTSMPARLYGRADVGTLEPGARANLVLWSGDPLEVTSTVERVWIDGVEQSLRTRQTELVERYKSPGMKR